MNRIELYLDRDNRLTLDFFINENDEYPMAQYKGQKCYRVVLDLCKNRILTVNSNSSAEEISVIFDNNLILNISDCNKLFKKRGTATLRDKIKAYYEEKKLREINNKKVKRKNKYVGLKIIAGVVTLSLLGGIAAYNLFEKNTPTEDLPQDTSISYEIDIDDDIDNNEDNKGPSVVDLGFEENTSNTIQVCLDFDDFSETNKAKRTRDWYGKLIEKYAKMYGLDPVIVTAIATQERGVHSEIKDRGGATGLMQIQNSVWVGKKITAYNYNTGSRESIIVDEDSLSKLDYNIKVGCMYFQNCMDYMDNNIFAAIQCYNYGCGNMQKVLNEYSKKTGKSQKEILSNIADCGWLDCRYVVSTSIGDRGYLEHVLMWIGSDINLTNLKFGGNLINLNITNQNQTKVK